MGEATAQTVREIEATRGRLERELQELEGRLPVVASSVKRVVGLAVGGGVGGAAFWFLVRRARKRRRKAERVPIQPVIQVLPERWAQSMAGALEDWRWRAWTAGAGALWVLLRLAELRQLRRTNRLLLAGARAPIA